MTEISGSPLLGKGDGTLGKPVSYAAGNGPRTVITADFDSDDHADLVVVNRKDDNVSVLSGRGDGTFRAAVNYAAGEKNIGKDGDAYDVVSADFSGDGKLDLAVANRESDDVSILLNSGDGTFQAGASYKVGDTPFAITSADFDGDGKADLAAANIDGKSVSILLGNGDGTFQAIANQAVGIHAFALTSADFDGDGSLDLAVVNNPYSINTYAGSVSILAGKGDGTFGEPVDHAVGVRPVSVTNADFNGDERPDLVTANRESDNVSVLLHSDTNLTLTTSSPLLTYGEATRLSGQLTSPSGEPLTGKRVILEQRPWIKKGFTPVPGQPEGGIPISSDGTFRVTGIEPFWTTDYRARFVGEPGSGIRPVASPLAAVNLKVRVTLEVAGGDLELGQSRKISGKVAPPHEQMAVKLTIKRDGAVVGKKTVDLVDSRYSFEYTPSRTGNYSVVASFPDHPPGHLGNTSSTKSFRVVR